MYVSLSNYYALVVELPKPSIISVVKITRAPKYMRVDRVIMPCGMEQQPLGLPSVLGESPTTYDLLLLE